MTASPPANESDADPELSVVIPVHDEGAGLELLFERLLPVLDGLDASHELVVVDDGSRDDSLARLRRVQAERRSLTVVELARNFGKEAALTAGLEHARGRAVIPMDADLQAPPELIPEFVARRRAGAEVVYGVRRSREGEGLFRRFAAWGFYRCMRLVSEVPIPEDTGDFRLLDRRAVDVLLQMPERTRFMKGLFAWVGFRQEAVPFEREMRATGRSRFGQRSLWKLAFDGIVSFSALPLRIWSLLGVLIAAVSFGYGIFLVIRTLIHGVEIPGYASLMVAILFLNGLLMLSVGMLGEYIARIYAEVKGRPLYVVRNVHRG